MPSNSFAVAGYVSRNPSAKSAYTRPSSSSSETASARISRSDKSLKFRTMRQVYCFWIGFQELGLIESQPSQYLRNIPHRPPNSLISHIPQKRRAMKRIAIFALLCASLAYAPHHPSPQSPPLPQITSTQPSTDHSTANS